VQPAKWTRRPPSAMKNRTYRRRSVAVSTVKKSQASTLAACRRRNAGQLTAWRRGAGSKKPRALMPTSQNRELVPQQHQFHVLDELSSAGPNEQPRRSLVESHGFVTGCPAKGAPASVIPLENSSPQRRRPTRGCGRGRARRRFGAGAIALATANRPQAWRHVVGEGLPFHGDGDWRGQPHCGGTMYAGDVLRMLRATRFMSRARTTAATGSTSRSRCRPGTSST
jgi:hypothetical protein